MIQVKDGVATVAVAKKLTKRQEYQLKSLPEARQQEYVASILGLVKNKVRIPRAQKYDPLEDKGRMSVVEAFNQSINPRYEHAPLNISHGNWIGVEIECFLPGDDDESECDTCCGSGAVEREVAILDDDGDETGDYDYSEVSCDDCDGRGYIRGSGDARGDLRAKIRAAKLSRVTVKEDGSLDDDEGVGVEVTLVYNTAHGHGKLQKLLEVLNSAGAWVNDTCGLHVHLDMRHARVEAQKAGFGDDLELVREYGERIGRALPVLKYMVPSSRRDNQYCQLGVSDFDGERYYAVNLTAFEKFQTIEVRLHSGTTDFDKISNWIDLLKLIVKSPNARPLRSFQDLLDVTQMPDSLVAYVEKRLQLHGPEFLNQLSMEVA